MVKTKRSKFMLASLDGFSAGFRRGVFYNCYENLIIDLGGNRFWC